MFKLIADAEDSVQYDICLEKELKKLPIHIIEKLKMWAKTVNNHGILEARKCKGYHDEPLKGERQASVLFV